jgi:three-Cys-motif partner protein
MFADYQSSISNEKIGHFSFKSIHTEIKHLILRECIKQSAIVANYFAKLDKIPSKNGQIKRYCYLDFYAGQGMFDDGQNGSPLIALETVNKHMTCIPVSFVFCEKDKASYDSLNSITKDEKNVDCFCGAWRENSQQIFGAFHVSQWGFAFVDPFDNFKTKEEFDMLIDFFSQTTLKDMLFFFNIQALKRMFTDYRQQVLNLFSATEEDIDRAEHFSDGIFSKLVLAKAKKMKKKFIDGAAIPNSTNDKLNDSNAFYMMLVTNSSGVIFPFYEAYAKTLEQYKKCQQTSLFPQISTGDKILSILSSSFIGLSDLSKQLLSEFVGWKETNSIDMLPTKDNICNAINNLIKDGRVQIHFTEDGNKYVDKSGLLRKTAFSSNRALENIAIAKL